MKNTPSQIASVKNYANIHGSIRKAAAILGVNDRTMGRWINNESRIPAYLVKKFSTRK